MNMKNYIEKGEKKAGKQTELAKILGISEANIRATKRGERGLPDSACIVLAEYIEENPIEVIAASNLVTEKDEERKKIFERYLKKSNSAAASMTLTLIVTMISTLAPEKPANARSQDPYNLQSTHYTQLLIYPNLRKSAKTPLIVSQETPNQASSKCPWCTSCEKSRPLFRIRQAAKPNAARLSRKQSRPQGKNRFLHAKTAFLFVKKEDC